MPGYEPPTPSGATALHNWAKHTGDVAHRVRRIHFSGGLRGLQTPQGFAPRIAQSEAGDFELPPGFEVVELSVCHELDNGTTEERWIRVLACSYNDGEGTALVYKKDSQDRPIHPTTSALLDEDSTPPLADLGAV